MTPGTVRRWLRGAGSSSTASLLRLAGLFELSWEALLDGLTFGLRRHERDPERRTD